MDRRVLAIPGGGYSGGANRCARPPCSGAIGRAAKAISASSKAIEHRSTGHDLQVADVAVAQKAIDQSPYGHVGGPDCEGSVNDDDSCHPPAGALHHAVS